MRGSPLTPRVPQIIEKRVGIAWTTEVLEARLHMQVVTVDRTKRSANALLGGHLKTGQL